MSDVIDHSVSASSPASRLPQVQHTPEHCTDPVGAG
ncbi:hypothetical protein PMI38_01043, partial [Pseudomonas sp. GM84]